MCLKLPNSTYVYKLYERQRGHSDPHLVNGFYISYSEKLELNKVLTSSRDSAALTRRELVTREVNHGLHAFDSLKAAKNHLDGAAIIVGYVIARFRAFPEDFVAANKSEVVYHKLTFDAIEDYGDRNGVSQMAQKGRAAPLRDAKGRFV